MASKSSNSVTTVYQCSECNHCSQNLDEATLHAVQEHGDEDRDEDDMQEESEEESYQKIQIKKDLVSSDEDYSSSSIYKQTNGTFDEKEGQGNIRNAEKWSADSTKMLLDCIQEHYADLKSKQMKKKPIWEQIRAELENQVIDVTASKCEQRWRSLVSSYKKYVASCNKPYGKSKFKKPDFFDEVSDIVGSDSTPDTPHQPPDQDSSSFYSNFKGKKSKKDSLAYTLQSILNDEDSRASTSVGGLNPQQGSDALLVLGSLVSILERREAANEKYQREILEVEREKLKCAQRFVEGREKFNAKRLQLMKDWMMSQPKAKRRREDED